jgi:hypothetical protein
MPKVKKWFGKNAKACSIFNHHTIFNDKNLLFLHESERKFFLIIRVIELNL